MASELSDKEDQNHQQEISQDPQQEVIPKEENNQILIKNIPPTATEDLIQKNFEKFGKIVKITIPPDVDGKPIGEALIEFETKEEKELVLNSNEEFELDGKKVEVKDPNNESLTLFVGNIPYSSKEEDIIEFFSDCGKVDVKFFFINHSFKGYAHVTFQDENAVELALKKQGEKIGNREIKIEKLKPRSFINVQRGRRGGYRGGRGRGGQSFGHFDRERKEDYFRERRERDRYRDFERGRPYNRTRERDRERDWNRDRRERSRDRSREYNRIRDRGERNRNERGDRDRDRDRERERDRHREFERDRERDRGERYSRGDRDRERDREREKENIRHREYERERERERSNRERDRDRDRERRQSNYEADNW